MNLKYAATEKINLRFANSYSTTLPEFKEIAPFEYVSAVGQVTRGNKDIEASLNTNYDLKSKFTFVNISDVLIYEINEFTDQDIYTLYTLRLSIPHYEPGEYEIGNMKIVIKKDFQTPKA